MSASSPVLAVLAVVARPRTVPRPRPRLVVARPEALPVSVPPRLTLKSIDVEDAGEHPPSSSVPPPLPVRARAFRRPLVTPREAHPEALDCVVTELADLSFFETVVEAACFGLTVAMRAIPSLGGLALVRDEERGGYMVVYACGRRASEIVRLRVAEDDPIVAAALVHGGPIALDYDDDTRVPDRHALLGDPWATLVAPVQDAERCLAMLELVDPLAGRDVGDAGRHVLSSIARALAEFARGRRAAVANVFAPEQVGLE